MQLNISDEIETKLEAKAQECEVDPDWLISEGLNLMANFDPSVLIRMRYFSDGLSIPLWQVIQNILISDWARKSARMRVEGPGSQELPEFTKETFSDGIERVKTGQDLFNWLKQAYIDELTCSERIKQADKQWGDKQKHLKPGEGPATSEELSHRKQLAEIDANPDLTPEQKEVLKRDRELQRQKEKQGRNPYKISRE
jgi:hypothetical protein